MLRYLNTAYSLAVLSSDIIVNIAIVITLIAYTTYGNDLSPTQVDY